jgi:uncharacterized membrane protein YoaK (UPF0700 family)
VLTGATGLLLLLGAPFLAGLLELPEVLLRSAGLVLLPFVAFVAYVATREHFHRSAIWTVIGVNALWAAASVALLLSGWVAPNLFGAAFVIFQAVVVAVFAELEYLGVRRSVTSVA